MSKVSKICITDNSGENMKDALSIEVVANKGIVNDRYFNDDNDLDIQITLIESENIDYYNAISGTNIPYINFRRNIITQGIELNNLVGKIILIGKNLLYIALLQFRHNIGKQRKLHNMFARLIRVSF